MNKRKMTLCVGVLASVSALYAPQLRAQIVTQDANGLYRNQSGNVFHSESSAQMDQMIQNNMAMSNAMTQIYMNAVQADILREQQQSARGQSVIKSGRASTRFPMRAYPMDYWMKNTVVNKAISAEEDRRIRYNGIVVQRQKFAQEMKRRGAQWGDMADMLGAMMTIAYEAYSGKTVSNAGFRAMAKSWREGLLKDASFQGRTTEQKQQFYEGQMLDSTYAWYLRNQGDAKGARAQGQKFLDKWWTEKTAGVEKVLAPYSTASSTRFAQTPTKKAVGKAVAKTPTETTTKAPVALPTNAVRVSQATDKTAPGAPALSFEQAARITNFKRVSADVLPQKFASQLDDEKKRAQLEAVTRQLIDGARGDLMQNRSSNLPVDNVARAFNYYVTVLYPVAMSRDGQPLGSGLTKLTKAQTETLRRQFAQIIATNPNFQKLSDREKQESAEMYLLVPAMAGVLYEGALKTNDVQTQRSARQMARNALQKTFGVAPEKLRFTDNGLQIN